MRRAFISPSKYVQGKNELLNLGYFVRDFGKKALLIAHEDDIERVQSQLEETSQRFGVEFISAHFGGECSRDEIDRLIAFSKEHQSDCVVGLGGGKAIDTAKVVAKDQAVIIVPTIAATDAPTSHSAVIYHEDGSFDDYAYPKKSPDVVLVDTQVIAEAPTRFLVAGMGDALSTIFEARASVRSYSRVNASLPAGALSGECEDAVASIAAQTLAKASYEVLLENAYAAKLACDQNQVTPALENIVETNILLSGLGFESAGLAATHAIHNGLTALEGTHAYYHGEKVAFSILVQLVLENAKQEEIQEVMDFSLSIGLPVCLADIGVDSITEKEALEVAKIACIPEESIHAMPFPVTEEAVASALIVADEMGKAYKAKVN